MPLQSRPQPKVVIVNSDNTAAYVNAAQAMTNELIYSGLSAKDIQQLGVSEWSKQMVQVQQTRIYVALGTTATAALAAAKVTAPVVAALIPRSSFERVLRDSARKPSSQLTAIYLDQPLLRQLALIRLALPHARQVSVLWGPDSSRSAPLLRSLVSANGLTLQEAGLESNFNVFQDLQQVLNESDVFLALADPVVFNSNSIQNILLTTFRANVPVVAFSPAYVRAGALLALYATPEQVGKQAAMLVQDVLHGQALPGRPLESSDFEVSVNEHVARAMNLTLDAKVLRLELRAMEQK